MKKNKSYKQPIENKFKKIVIKKNNLLFIITIAILCHTISIFSMYSSRKKPFIKKQSISEEKVKTPSQKNLDLMEEISTIKQELNEWNILQKADSRAYAYKIDTEISQETWTEIEEVYKDMLEKQDCPITHKKLTWEEDYDRKERISKLEAFIDFAKEPATKIGNTELEDKMNTAIEELEKFVFIAKNDYKRIINKNEIIIQKIEEMPHPINPDLMEKISTINEQLNQLNATIQEKFNQLYVNLSLSKLDAENEKIITAHNKKRLHMQSLLKDWISIQNVYKDILEKQDYKIPFKEQTKTELDNQGQRLSKLKFSVASAKNKTKIGDLNLEKTMEETIKQLENLIVIVENNYKAMTHITDIAKEPPISTPVIAKKTTPVAVSKKQQYYDRVTDTKLSEKSKSFLTPLTEQLNNLSWWQFFFNKNLRKSRYYWREIDKIYDDILKKQITIISILDNILKNIDDQLLRNIKNKMEIQEQNIQTLQNLLNQIQQYTAVGDTKLEKLIENAIKAAKVFVTDRTEEINYIKRNCYEI